MTSCFTRAGLVAVLCAATLSLSACSTGQAIDTTVDVAAGATKLVAKGAFGTGKMAYKGGSSLVQALN